MTEHSQTGIVAIAKAGINRFFDEGYSRWPESKLMVLFNNQPLNTAEIDNALREWESQGCIDLCKKPNEYIRVLKIIE